MLQLTLPLILYIVPAAILFYMSIEIYMRNRQGPEHRLAALLTFLFALWFVGDYLRALFPLEYSKLIVINIITPISFLSMGVAFQLVAEVVDNKVRNSRLTLYLISYSPMVFMFILTHTTDWVYRDFVQYGMWKKPVFGPAYAIAIICALFYTLLPAYNIWRAKRHVTSPRRARQFNGLIVGICAVIGWIVLFSALPEFIPYMKEHFPLMVVFGNIIWAVCLWIVMVKYDFLPSYERRFQALYELFPSAIILLNRHMHIVEANKNAVILLDPSGKRVGFNEMVVNEERQAFIDQYVSNFSEHLVIRNKQLTIRLRNGTIKHLLIDSDFVEMEHDWLQMFIVRDISESKEHERKLTESEERYRQTAHELEIVTRSTSDGIFSWELDTGDIHWNERTFTIFEPLIGEIPLDFNHYKDILHPDDIPSMKQTLDLIMHGENSFHTEHRLRGVHGEVVWVYATGEVLLREDGRPMRVIGSITDITERKRAEQKIADLAYRDSLTGLYNRLYFNEILEKLVISANNNHHNLALLLIDLDRFKMLNDNWGHLAGDQLLCHVAKELQALVGNEQLVARLGGDEFVIVMQNREQAEELARAILYRVQEPFAVGEEGQLFYYGASIGISIFPEDGVDTKTLIQNADMAMYASKDAGRGQYIVYTPNIALKTSAKMLLENHLRGAWERGELELFYQPQIQLNTGTIVGAEALLRWNSPNLGNVSTLEIILLAEENGFIIPIGEWVLYSACRQGRQWMDKLSAPFTISVNVSGHQLQNEFFVARVIQILKETQFDPNRLCLEITETLALHDMEASAHALRQLAVYGVKVSIDDFGAGYSSMNAIKWLPVSEVKIDQSLIKDAIHIPNHAAIVRAMINMVRSLGLIVTAEGIEHEEQLDFLKQADCDRGQGYWIGKPIPAKQFELQFLSNLYTAKGYIVEN